MYELTMENQVVPFNFGMGFLREMNKKVAVPVDGLRGVAKGVGYRYYLANMLEGDVESLVEILDTANKGCDPRVSKDAIDKFVDDEGTNIDDVFEKVLDFLKTANATRKVTLEVVEAVEKEKKKQEAMDTMRAEAMA